MGSLRLVATLLPILVILIEAETSLRRHQPNQLSSRNFDPTSLGAFHQRTDLPKRDNPLLDTDPAHESRLLSRQPYDTLTDLEKKWYISLPEFSYHGYEFQLHYNISTGIADEALGFKVFDSMDCSQGSNEVMQDDDNDYLFFSTEEAAMEATTDEFWHMTAKLRVDTDRIRFTPLYLDYGPFSQISLCVKLGAFHEEEGWGNTIEVNWVETPVVLMMDSLSFSIGGSAPFESAYSVYETRSVDVELCDNGGSNIIGTSEESQEGQAVRVCVNAGNQTLTEGGTLLYVEEFSYSRSEVSQQAIEPRTGGEPAPASAPLQCAEDSDVPVCYFETFLGPEFFSSTGIINGYGTAFLQFGGIKDPIDGVTVDKLDTPVESGTSGDVRIVPVRFGLKMVALPSEDRSSSSSNMLRAMQFALFAIGKLLLCFFLW